MLNLAITRLSEKIADALDLIEPGAGRDKQDLVEADLLQAFQPPPRFIGQTDQGDLRPLRNTARFGPGREIDDHIGEDSVAAADLSVEAHPVFEILPTAVEPGSNPPLALLSGVGNPTLVTPGPEQHRRSTLVSRPRREHTAVDRLAAPGAAHDLERA